MARTIQELPTPCFLVDIDKVKENADRMRHLCDELGVTLRPHTKTHKTVQGGTIQTNGSKRCIAVSTIPEAEAFAADGFEDILYAYPIVEDKIPRCLTLLKTLAEFHVMVSDREGFVCLENNAGKLSDGKKWTVVLEVDTGYGRTGFLWNSKELCEIATDVVASKSMCLMSLYTHCGSSYSTTSAKERGVVQRSVVERLLVAKSQVELQTGDSVTVTTGSTPSCSLPDAANSSLNEFHPGNYIFYDYEQVLLNACRQSSIAGRVMTRVIAHKPELNMILVDCGFLALSHDGMRQRPDDFCIIEGETNLKLIDMCQEIGKIKAKEGDLDCRNYPVGTVLFIHPYHSCATAALHPVYYVHKGDEIVDKWTPVKGW